MKFSILALCGAVTYVAMVLASLRYPTPALEASLRISCQCAVAVALVVAFDRRSTPLFSFVVFAALGGTTIASVSSSFILWILKTLKIPTGSMEYIALESILYYQLIIVCALIGYLFGVTLVSRRRPKEMGSRANE